MGVICINSKDTSALPDGPSAHDTIGELMTYPSHVRDDAYRITVTQGPDYAYPYRMSFMGPQVHPEYPSYRLCPNFPSIYINSKGKILGDEALTSFTTYGNKEYVLTRVPGMHLPVFVSKFRLYADAWAILNEHKAIALYPVPRNGYWMEYRPGNVKWCNAHYRHQDAYWPQERYRYEAIDPDSFVSIDFPSMADCFSHMESLNRDRRRLGGIEVNGPKIALVRTCPPSHNIDYCHDYYWIQVVYDASVDLVRVFTDRDSVKAYLRKEGYPVSNQLLRHIHRTGDLCHLSKDKPPVFLDWNVESIMP